ncbi:DUF4864 domain-containing protein [Pseudooceanicola sp.]|uniref:DUF4864 domain-containing protein n=1 Tax=Pseudooceanicola sp. TaxID=1914328 RepID=UPI0035C6C52E
MRAILLLVLTILLAGPLQAQDGPGSVIRDQFQAFRADDLPRAFSHASPMIQGYFQTPDRFGRMVEQGYPQIREPGEVTLQELREEGGRLIQRLTVFDGNGLPHLFDYEVIRTENGWKINGVRYVKGPPMSV